MSRTASSSSILDEAGARKADLAAIHIGKKQFGWDDSMYRDLLWTVCQVRSSGDLDFSGRKRFLAHMRACGFVAGPAKVAARTRKAWTPEQRLVWSLWQQLADAGLVRHRTRKALDAWIKRCLHVDVLEFLNRQQLDHCVAILRRWLARREEPNRAA